MFIVEWHVTTYFSRVVGSEKRVSFLPLRLGLHDDPISPCFKKGGNHQKVYKVVDVESF